jgi:GTP-binding protein Era
METLEPTPHRCGTVCLVGRPNAGKSTLLNQLLGAKIAAISHKPQTTRNRITGIYTQPGLQAIVLDTPGIHRTNSKLNRAMVGVAKNSMRDVDLVVFLLDSEATIKRMAKGGPVLHRGHETISMMISERHEGGRVIVLNKVDRVSRPALLPVIGALAERFPGVAIVPLSARTGEGLDSLVSEWQGQLPEGPPVFPEDQIADASMRFLVTEMIREKIFRLTHEEIPYATAVEIEQWNEDELRPDGGGRIVIHARIFVERAGQKGIVIGKGGLLLKEIGTAARKDIEALLGVKINLQLHVAVQKGWTDNQSILRDLGIE